MGIYYVGYLVENLKSGVLGEGDVIGIVYMCIVYWSFGSIIIYGSENSYVGIICIKLKYIVYSIGKIGMYLSYKNEIVLLCRDGMFIEIFLVVYFES